MLLGESGENSRPKGRAVSVFEHDRVVQGELWGSRLSLHLLQPGVKYDRLTCVHMCKHSHEGVTPQKE